MPRFFVQADNIASDTVTITGDDAWHIARALRMAVGERVTVCDGEGNEHDCTLTAITDTAATAHIDGTQVSASEMPFTAVLYQALPKGDKMDLIVQKAVEQGAAVIVPFLSERCISRPDDKAMAKKLQRWQRIAVEAAKQCGRGILPTVAPPLSYSEMLAAVRADSLCCFCYEGAGTRSLRAVLTEADLPKGGRVSVVIGSEGGFSEKEADAARDAGVALCGLGRRILRCESASGFALACLSYQFEL